MQTRTYGETTYMLTYDAENRLTSVSGGATATFVYDGDGNRVKGTAGGVTTIYIGNYFEYNPVSGDMKLYYYAGGQRIAMRTIQITPSLNTVNYLLTDHLGGTNVTVTTAGVEYGEVRYRAFGAQRYASGTTPTTFRFTGQRQESYINLYWYNSRWYDPALGRFVSPDSIIPAQQGVMGNDRYAYTNNNPIIHTDPTGHYEEGDCTTTGDSACEEMQSEDDEEGPTITETIIDLLIRDDGTFGFGISGTAGAAIYITGSVGVQIDSQGNIGLAISIGGGGMLPAAVEIAPYGTWTDADNINQLKGWSLAMGGSVEADGSVGYESVFFKDQSTGVKMEGGSVTIGGGAAAPIPAEGHIGVNYTWIPWFGNVYDIFHLDRP